METNSHRSEFEDDLLVQRLGEAFREARENGKNSRRCRRIP